MDDLQKVQVSLERQTDSTINSSLTLDQLSKDKSNISFGNDDGISKPVLKVASNPDEGGPSMADIFKNVTSMNTVLKMKPKKEKSSLERSKSIMTPNKPPQTKNKEILNHLSDSEGKPE